MGGVGAADCLILRPMGDGKMGAGSAQGEEGPEGRGQSGAGLEGRRGVCRVGAWGSLGRGAGGPWGARPAPRACTAPHLHPSSGSSASLCPHPCLCPPADPGAVSLPASMSLPSPGALPAPRSIQGDVLGRRAAVSQPWCPQPRSSGAGQAQPRAVFWGTWGRGCWQGSDVPPQHLHTQVAGKTALFLGCLVLLDLPVMSLSSQGTRSSGHAEGLPAGSTTHPRAGAWGQRGMHGGQRWQPDAPGHPLPLPFASTPSAPEPDLPARR